MQRRNNSRWHALGDGRWRLIEPHVKGSTFLERDLSRLLLESSEPLGRNLLPLGEYVTCPSAAGDAQRQADLIFLTPAGSLVIVELKVRPSSRQLWQALEYAARLQNVGLDDVLELRARQTESKKIASADAIMQAILGASRTLATLPEIRLVAPSFDTTVRGTARLLTSAGLQVRLLQLRQWCDRDLRILEIDDCSLGPSHQGRRTRRRSGGPSRKQIAEAKEILTVTPDLTSVELGQLKSIHPGHARKVLQAAREELIGGVRRR